MISWQWPSNSGSETLIAKSFLLLIILVFSGCAATQVCINKGDTIAVWDLENVTPGISAYPDLGELLSGRIIETLQKKGDYIVVEREKLILALEELGLGSAKLVDESVRLKLGMMIGARLMIFGGYQVIGEHMRIDLRVVEVETGRLIKADQKTVMAEDFNGWLRAAGEVAEKLIRPDNSNYTNDE